MKFHPQYILAEPSKSEYTFTLQTSRNLLYFSHNTTKDCWVVSTGGTSETLFHCNYTMEEMLAIELPDPNDTKPLIIIAFDLLKMVHRNYRIYKLQQIGIV